MISHKETIDNYQEIAEGWAAAIQTRRFDRIAQLCDPNIRSRLMWTNGFASLESADAMISKIGAWFDESDPIEIRRLRTHPVGDKLSISYFLVLRERGEWFEVEHQIFGTLKEGVFSELDLMCSGFRPLPKSTPADQQTLSGPFPTGF